MRINSHGAYLPVLILAGVLLLGGGQAQAQVSANELAKSLVRVKVTGGTLNGKPRGTGYASGFVWQNPLQVVTSLHAMRRGSDVQVTVEWTSAPTKEKGGPWKAVVKKVYQKADLVLLEVAPGRLPPPEWQPLTQKALKKVGSELIAMGYFRSSQGWRRMSLKVTQTQRDNLQDFPGKVVDRLREIGIPDITLDIIHFENNSLLPGYSGAPLVDANGRLVGIGDGGLENGDKNLSWGIPAKFLDDLMASTTSALPLNLDSAPLHYSAEEPATGATLENKLISNKTYSVEQYQEERLEAIELGGYEFYYTKTRSLGELIESADNPESLYSLLWQFAGYYFGVDDQAEWTQALNIFKNNFFYDIYQDINYGVIVAVPTGATLQTDVEDGLLWVDFGDEKVNDIWEITYQYDADVTPEDYALLNQPNALLESISKQLSEDLADINGTPVARRKASRILRTSGGGLVNTFHDIFDPSGNQIAFNFDKIVISQSVYLVASSFFHDYNKSNLDLINRCRQQGIDCTNVPQNSTCQTMCSLAVNWLYLMTAQHLTSFVDFDTRQATVVPFETGAANQSPAVQFLGTRVSHNATGTDGRPGMIVHVNFAIQNMRNVACQAVAYFYDANGRPLRDLNKQYYSSSGQVITQRDFTPKYPDTRYNDLQLFLPYNELHVNPGQWQLRYRVVLFDKNGWRPIATAPDANFYYTQY